MTITRGDRASRIVTVRSRTTNLPVDLSGFSARFACRAALGSPVVIEAKSTIDDPLELVIAPDQAEGAGHHRGEVTITFDPEDFEDFVTTRVLVWGLEVVDASDNPVEVIVGRLLVKLDVVTPAP